MENEMPWSSAAAATAPGIVITYRYRNPEATRVEIGRNSGELPTAKGTCTKSIQVLPRLALYAERSYHSYYSFKSLVLPAI